MTQPCPQSAAGSGKDTGPWPAWLSGEDSCWRDDQTCSYCGSLSNDYLMERLRAGDVECGPTDKAYKVYVRNKGGESFKQSYRKCPEGSTCTPKDCSHWVTREVEETKFYFQHFTQDQMREFVKMMNSGLISMGYPGHFYTLPFFISRSK